MLNNVADQTKKTKSVLRERIGHAAEATPQRLKDAGKDVAKATAEAAGKAGEVMTEEARELGKRSVDIARRAVSGLWKGAKDVLKKGGKEE